MNRYKVSCYTDTRLGNDNEPCKWVVRYGNEPKYWALTTCKRGFNPLRGNTVEQVKDLYEGRICLICGRPIHLQTTIVEEQEYV